MRYLLAGPLSLKLVRAPSCGACLGLEAGIRTLQALLWSVVFVPQMLMASGRASLGENSNDRHPAGSPPASCQTTAQTLWPQASAEPGITSNPRNLLDNQPTADGGTPAQIDELQRNLGKEPQNGEYTQALTLALIQSRRYDLAEAVIARYKSQCGATGLAYGLAAELHFQQRRYDDAYREATESLRISPGSAGMHELLGLILILRRDYPAALPVMEKAAQEAPDNSQIRYFYGRLLYSTGHYPEALQEFLSSLKSHPSQVKALENLGLCYEALQEFPEAAEAYQKAIKYGEAEGASVDVEPDALYGALLAKLRRNVEALTILRKAVTTNPQSFRASYALGKLLLDNGDLGQAEHYLLEAAALDPKFAQTYYLLGRIYSKEHRNADAESYFAVFQQLNKVPANRDFPYPLD
jgi:tetratricopeptide (TPR) repeat protein